MDRKALSYVDVLIGEATPWHGDDARYEDMLAIASVIENRARAMRGVTVDDVYSVTDEFNAYNNPIPSGGDTEKYREMAKRAIAEVRQFGPTTRATFYATPDATGRLPEGTVRIGATRGHEFRTDPRREVINTRLGYKRPDYPSIDHYFTQAMIDRRVGTAHGDASPSTDHLTIDTVAPPKIPIPRPAPRDPDRDPRLRPDLRYAPMPYAPMPAPNGGARAIEDVTGGGAPWSSRPPQSPAGGGGGGAPVPRASPGARRGDALGQAIEEAILELSQRSARPGPEAGRPGEELQQALAERYLAQAYGQGRSAFPPAPAPGAQAFAPPGRRRTLDPRTGETFEFDGLRWVPVR